MYFQVLRYIYPNNTYLCVCTFRKGVCLSVCQLAGWLFGVLVCWFVGLLVCLFVCLLVCLFVCQFACVFVCLFVCLFVCSFASSCRSCDLFVGLSTCVRGCYAFHVFLVLCMFSGSKAYDSKGTVNRCAYHLKWRPLRLPDLLYNFSHRKITVHIYYTKASIIGQSLYTFDNRSIDTYESIYILCRLYTLSLSEDGSIRTIRTITHCPVSSYMYYCHLMFDPLIYNTHIDI